MNSFRSFLQRRYSFSFFTDTGREERITATFCLEREWKVSSLSRAQSRTHETMAGISPVLFICRLSPFTSHLRFKVITSFYHSHLFAAINSLHLIAISVIFRDLRGYGSNVKRGLRPRWILIRHRRVLSLAVRHTPYLRDWLVLVYSRQDILVM